MTHLDVFIVKHQYANSLAQCKQAGPGFERRAVVNNASQAIGAARIEKAPASVRQAGEEKATLTALQQAGVLSAGWVGVFSIASEEKVISVLHQKSNGLARRNPLPDG